MSIKGKTIKDFYGPVTGIISLVFAAGMTYAAVKGKVDKEDFKPIEVTVKANDKQLENTVKQVEELQKLNASFSEILKSNSENIKKISENCESIRKDVNDAKKDIAVQNEIVKRLEIKIDKLDK